MLPICQQKSGRLLRSMSKKDMYGNNIVLDATMRDGGLVNNHYFEDDFVKKLYQMNCAAGTDYMEFGYRADKKLFSPEKYGKWKFSSDDDIRRIIEGNESNLKISIMVDTGRCDYKNSIHEKKESPVDLIRVATYIDTIFEAVKIIDYVYGKGYETTCNIMAVSECSQEQLVNAIQILSQTPVRTVYIVDSFGALYPKQVRNLVQLFKNRLDECGKAVGIHAHNNQQCAFANSVEAISEGAVWIDATVFGMGRGAGNCHLEGLLGYLKRTSNDLNPILSFIESDMIPLKESGIEWGYNSYYLLTGLKNKHPQKAITETKQKSMHLVDFARYL